MISPTLEKELHQQLEYLPLVQQRQVLDFARALSIARSRGVSGKSLLRFAGVIEPDDLESMRQTIESDCGKVDAHEW